MTLKDLVRGSVMEKPARTSIEHVREFRKNYSYIFLNQKLKSTPDVVFIWIPKSSGSTLFAQLERGIGLQKILEPERFLNFPNCGAVTPGHVHWLSLVKSGLVSKEYSDRAYKFSIVRNPYTRAVSIYNHLRKLKILGDDMCFDRFLNVVATERPPVGLYNIAGLSQTNPQVDWLLDEDGKICVDALYRIEDIGPLHHDFQERFGVALDDKEKKNVSIKFVANDFVFRSRERLDLVEEIYRRDFVLLGYDRLSEASDGLPLIG